MRKEKTQLVPCEIMTGFFKTPGMPFSANRDGLVYSYETNEIPKAFFDENKVKENKYIHVGKQLSHRVVAKTFLEVPDGLNEETALVNHINGLKYDNEVTNLEWTDHVGNSVHAYAIGLRTENIRLKTLNIFTGEELHFYSMWDCARHFNINGAKVFGYLKRKRNDVLFEERCLLVREEEEFPLEPTWRNWELSVTDMDYVAFNLQTLEAIITDKRLSAFLHVGFTHRKARELINRSRKAFLWYITEGVWYFCPYSKFQFGTKKVTDLRKPREVRYANYHPHGKFVDTGLLNSNV